MGQLRGIARRFTFRKQSKLCEQWPFFGRLIRTPGSSSRDNFADDRPCIWPSGFVATVRVKLVWAVTQWKFGCGLLVLVGRWRS